MGINADSKATVLITQPSNSGQRQPPIPTYSKAAVAGGAHHNRNIMATIADDDDRLLARIGYTPVRASEVMIVHSLILGTGAPPSLLEMVHSLVCYLDSRCTRFSASDVRRSNDLRWTSNGCVGMVHWQHHGVLHSKLRCDTRQLYFMIAC